jgi:hypothetical protein
MEPCVDTKSIARKAACGTKYNVYIDLEDEFEA